jgi:hypothetical protein
MIPLLVLVDFVKSFVLWWMVGGSNPRPPHCERGALPAELTTHNRYFGFELSLIGGVLSNESVIFNQSNRLSANNHNRVSNDKFMKPKPDGITIRPQCRRKMK